MSSALHLAVRTVHLLGMVALVGGSAATWYALRTTDRVTVPQLRRFECAFWGVTGLLLATGVGNLGALGAPGPGTRWGGLLTVKLLVVLAVVLGSFVRTSLVVRLPDGGAGSHGGDAGRHGAVPNGDDAHDDTHTVGGRESVLERFYLVTTWSLLIVVALAEVLAHG